jgi:hypothetical protein
MIKEKYETSDERLFESKSEAEEHDRWLLEMEAAMEWIESTYLPAEKLDGRMAKRMIHACACYKLDYIPPEKGTK